MEFGDQAPTGAALLSSWVFPTLPEGPTSRHLEVVGRTRLPSPGWMGNHRSRLRQPVCLVKPGLHACFRCVLPSLGIHGQPFGPLGWDERGEVAPAGIAELDCGGRAGCGRWQEATVDTACRFPGAPRPVGRRGCGEPGRPWIRGLAEGRLSHGLGDMPAVFP